VVAFIPGQGTKSDEAVAIGVGIVLSASCHTAER